MKKDSSEIVPFISKVYFQSDLDSPRKLPDRLYFNHRLNENGNFQNYSVLSGTLGSTLVPVLFENVFYTNVKLGRQIADYYFYTPQNIPYFALNKPLSELDFTFFGNGNEEFKGFFSQNISEKINLGIGIRRANNKGYFLNQENTHNNVYVYLVSDANRLRTNVEFVLNDFNTKESGGYQPDIYESNVAPGQWLAASPTLATAKNQLKSYQVSFRYRYLLLGMESGKDSLLFVPKRSRLYIDHQLQRFSDRQFYYDTVNTNSRDEYGVLASTISNQLGSVYLHTGYSSDFRLNYIHKGIKLSAFQILSDNSIEIGQQFGQYIRSYDYINVGLGLDVQYQWKDNLTIQGKGYKSFVGYTENDFYLHGELQARLADISLQSWVRYSHQKPIFLSSMNYTNGIDRYYELNTQKILENGFAFQSEKLKLSGKLQYFFIEDFMSYDTLLVPIQLQNNFFQLYLKKEWGYKNLYFPTEVYFQNSVFPRSMLRQMLAYKSKLFNDKNNVLVGAELSLNYNFGAAKYASFFMQPIYTLGQSTSKIYPKLDLFATFKISKVHLSLIFDNFLSTYLKTGVSYMQNHPMTPSAFYLRMNWRFLE